jgi:hypothetical protein
MTRTLMVPAPVDAGVSSLPVRSAFRFTISAREGPYEASRTAGVAAISASIALWREIGIFLSLIDHDSKSPSKSNDDARRIAHTIREMRSMDLETCL